MLIIIPIVLMIVCFCICIVRWGMYLYYYFNGRLTEAIVIKKTKSNLYVDNGTDMAIPYYKVIYRYTDENKTIHEGRLSKYYRENKYRCGDKLKIRYLWDKPSRSKCFALNEFFTYEPICLLISIILFVGLYIL